MTPPVKRLESVAPAYDVIVAGARVAGAATAMLMARAGMRVLMVDPRPPSQDTLSTHALMRGGVQQLHRWGVLPDVFSAGTPAIHSTVFDYGETRVEVAIKDRDGVRALCAPRRTTLDPILNGAAARAGVDIVYGVRLADLLTDPSGRVSGARLASRRGAAADIRAGLVVGADGKNSRVSKLVCARLQRVSRHATASMYGYVPSGMAPRGRFVWSFSPGGPHSAVTMGTIPTNREETCLFASTTPEAFLKAGRRGMTTLFVDTVARMDLDLAERLREAPGALALRAFPGMRGQVRCPVGPGWALVGDAGLFRDPATAHGITDALRDAESLVRAAIAGSMADYAEERDAVAMGLFDTTDAIAALDWDLDEVQRLHHELSRRMNDGVELIRRWDASSSSVSSAA